MGAMNRELREAIVIGAALSGIALAGAAKVIFDIPVVWVALAGYPAAYVAYWIFRGR